ncbi:MAG: radical SAM protein [Elusimicrobia bacterium]|nr:radical SAM protein [Elusimicrobiota bacterium]
MASRKDAVKAGGRASRAPLEEALAPGMRAPLYIGWQLTNACDLACVHCIEESGPGRAFKDELTREQAFRILEQIKTEQVPYVAFSGGEPFLHPHFLELAAFLGDAGVSLKVETNGRHLTEAAASALRDHGVRAVQVSLDGATPEAYRKVRPSGDHARVLAGIRLLRSRGVEVEVNFVPTRHNVHEIGAAVDLAFSEGVSGFYTGRLILAGHAAKARDLAPTQEQYDAFFACLKAKAQEYKGRMTVRYHELGIAQEVRYRMANPAALFVILPDGRVKLLNALPFVCGDLREQSLTEVWKAFLAGWKSPRVADFVGRLEADPGLLQGLHRWIPL